MKKNKEFLTVPQAGDCLQNYSGPTILSNSPAPSPQTCRFGDAWSRRYRDRILLANRPAHAAAITRGRINTRFFVIGRVPDRPILALTHTQPAAIACVRGDLCYPLGTEHNRIIPAGMRDAVRHAILVTIA